MDVEVEEVAAGVFVGVGSAGSNATVFRGEAATLCVDALATPSLARAFCAELVRRGVDDIDVLVYTHYHADHIAGSSALGTAPLVLAHEGSRRRVPNAQSEHVRAFLANRFPGEPCDEGVRPPTVTFVDEMRIHLVGAELLLSATGPAHTDSDVVIFDEVSRVLVTGDLVFNGVHPVLRDADVSGWISAIESLIDLGPEVVVPGHGPVTTVESLVAMRDGLAGLRRQVLEQFSVGASEQDILGGLDLGAFEGWTKSDRLTQTVRRIIQQSDFDPTRTAS